MPTVTLHGASDDLIELDGAIREEFNHWHGGNDDDQGALVAFSDGTVLRIIHGAGGIWRITPVATGAAELSIAQAPEGDDRNYSDVATLTGDIWWAVHGVAFAKAPTGAPADAGTAFAIVDGRPDLAALHDALTAVRHMMATSSRDWSLAKGDAWLYAILVGWNDDPDEPGPPVSALAHIAIRHGWSLGDMAALEAMHAAIVALDEAMA